MTTAAGGKRIRNAEATREAILRSALIRFSRAGYDDVGLREIAGEAGVTAMLVNRYFGSKEALFEAAVEAAFADGSMFSGDAADLAGRVASAIMGKTDQASGDPDPLMVMLRSAANPRTATILRESIRRHFEAPLAVLLPGDGTRERAALLLSVVAGFQLMKTIIGTEALRNGDRDILVGRLKEIFATLIMPRL